MNVIKKIFAVLIILFGTVIFLCGGLSIILTLNSSNRLAMIGLGLGIILFSFLFIVTGYHLFKGRSEKIQKVASSDIMSNLSQVDISNITSIFFIPTNGQAFLIKTPNIKRLAVYITNKMEKTVFEPEELRKVFDYVVKNISSDLSKRDLDLVTGKIGEFVKSGGEVKINRV